MKEQILKLENDLKELKEKYEKSLVSEKTEFKAGTYVRVITGGNGALCANGMIGTVIDKPNEKIQLSGMCFEDKGPFVKGLHGVVYHLNADECKMSPLTESEVKEALVKEAIKRGFKPGVLFKNNFTNPNGGVYGPYSDIGFEYRASVDTLAQGCSWIYKDGVWAEIVKESPIEIGGYEVKFCKETKGVDTTISGFEFSKDFWQAAKVISGHPKAKTMIGCSKQFDVSLEVINKILERLK